MLIRYGTDRNGKPVQKAVVYTKDEHHIPFDRVDPDAVYVISRLKESGFDAYIVGGAVRDLLVGHTPKDFDIVTDATPSRIKKIFRNSRIIGKRFRLVHVFFGQKIFEVSTFRSTVDGSVGNVFGTMDEDVMRRDFSLNALYYDPQKQQIIDYVDGVNDIKKGILKPIIPLENIFTEDPVRMIRAVKYASTTNCKISRSLKKKIRESAYLLSPISPSRLTEEFLKILSGAHSLPIVRLALDADIYSYIQPAAATLILEDRQFMKKYFESLLALDAFVAKNPSCRLGEKLVFILRDFVDSITDWPSEKKETPPFELYKRTWAKCRNFVLPINPQRTELEFAVKAILSEHDIMVKQTKKRRQPAVKKQPAKTAPSN